MEKLFELKEKLCEELEEIARKPDMGPGDLEIIHKLTDTIKNIGKIEMLDEEGGYSRMMDMTPTVAMAVGSVMHEDAAADAAEGIPGGTAWAATAGTMAVVK